jgi:hypothetical protein
MESAHIVSWKPDADVVGICDYTAPSPRICERGHLAQAMQLSWSTMRPLLLLALVIAVTGCSHYRPRGGVPIGNSAAEIVIVTTAFALAVAAEGDERADLWCEDDSVDPPHTCPATSRPTH